MKTKNIIGTDVSLKECEREGYLMLDTEGHETLDPNHQYHVFATLPAHMQRPFVKKAMAVDTTYSWNDAMRVYQQHKESIDKLADNMPDIMRTKEPGHYDLLNACDTINAYCGL